MAASGPSLENHLRLVGRLAGPCQIRYSPAGLPIARFVLDHHSQQWEAELPRQARCRITVLACGDKLVVKINQLSTDALIRVSGFISRANHRQAESKLVLHAQHIEILESS